jgi:hypothetical protein
MKRDDPTICHVILRSFQLRHAARHVQVDLFLFPSVQGQFAKVSELLRTEW